MHVPMSARNFYLKNAKLISIQSIKAKYHALYSESICLINSNLAATIATA